MKQGQPEAIVRLGVLSTIPTSVVAASVGTLGVPFLSKAISGSVVLRTISAVSRARTALPHRVLAHGLNRAAIASSTAPCSA